MLPFASLHSRRTLGRFGRYQAEPPSIWLSGRAWWAHFEFTRINIAPTILRKKIEDLREARAFVVHLGALPCLGGAGQLFAMVAGVHCVKPHVVFDGHRTETAAHDGLATSNPSPTFLVEPGERPFQADARLSRRGRSAGRVHRLVGLKPRRKYALPQDPVEVQSEQRAQESGGHRDRRSPRNDVGPFFQATRHMLHDLARRPFPRRARRSPSRR